MYIKKKTTAKKVHHSLLLPPDTLFSFILVNLCDGMDLFPWMRNQKDNAHKGF